MHILTQWNMIRRRLFASEPIGNFFYLHVVIFEIPKYYFIVKPPACWDADVSIEIYELLLLFTACLHETWSKHKPVWNLKLLWNVVPFTWEYTRRFHRSNFPNNGKTLMHMCKWYLVIIANLINLMQT